MGRAIRSLVTAVSLVLLPATALAGTFVSLDSPEAYDLQRVGFELTRETEVEIEATGIGEADAQGSRRWTLFSSRDESPFLVYAWLLDHESRQPVWEMDYYDAKAAEDGLRRVEDKVRLEPGRYELYLYSRLGWLARARRDGSQDSWLERMFTRRRISGRELLRSLESCHVSLAADGLGPRDVRRFDIDGGLPQALVRLNQVGDSQFAVAGFELDRKSNVRIYTVFEQRDRFDPAADYGWIVNEATREVVWSAVDARSEPAGGADKNRLFDGEVSLDPGRYLAYFGTDDSHSLEEFNTAAPLDPYNWGLTILPGSRFDSSSFKTFEPRRAEPLVELARAGDNEMLEQAFRLERAATLHVQALGEYSDREFYDRGWIVDAATGDSVWAMTGRNTTGAGGAQKNRMFDGLVELPAGDYVLYYVSDGSHSYDDWNAATPFEPDRWGVTLWPGPGLRRGDFSRIRQDEMAAAKGVLAQIVRVGDSERRRERFVIDNEISVVVYGLGEGRRGEMFDYGYIVDDSGHRVWEMSWDKTRHAGGADKNRVVNDELRLEPGEYEVVYRTDGSHAFGDWNAAPPQDPLNWGLTVRLARR